MNRSYAICDVVSIVILQITVLIYFFLKCCFCGIWFAILMIRKFHKILFPANIFDCRVGLNLVYILSGKGRTREEIIDHWSCTWATVLISLYYYTCLIITGMFHWYRVQSLTISCRVKTPSYFKSATFSIFQ